VASKDLLDGLQAKGSFFKAPACAAAQTGVLMSLHARGQTPVRLVVSSGTQRAGPRLCDAIGIFCGILPDNIGVFQSSYPEMLQCLQTHPH
jgi:hypothetical protein